MSSAALWQIEVAAAPALEPAARELLEALFACPACTFEPRDHPRATVSVYLSKRPAPAQLRLLDARLQALPGGAASVRVRRLGARDWVESWQRRIKPLPVGGALLIRPTWDATAPRPGQELIVLDPGLSFGTGHHPTTLYCLREIVRLRRAASGGLLDLGTGSGLLAIAAAKLGYRPVAALDNDPEAIRTARANARANGVARRIALAPGEVAGATGGPAYAVVCANLMDELLIRAREAIIRRTQPGGWMVLAGILTVNFPDVCRAYTEAGLAVARQWTRGEWTGVTFRRPPPGG